jgi:anti-sigma B factor antagonist
MDRAIADLGDRAAHREIYNRLHGAIDAGARYFILDLLGVPYLDSAALGLFVGLAKRVRGEGGSVWVAGAGASARRAFEITGLSRIFGMAPTVQDALGRLPPQRR